MLRISDNRLDYFISEDVPYVDLTRHAWSPASTKSLVWRKMQVARSKFFMSRAIVSCQMSPSFAFVEQPAACTRYGR